MWHTYYMAGKRHFQLTEQQQQELMVAYDECADGPTRTRLQAVRLYGSGYPVETIQEITGSPRRSVLRWCSRYRLQGAATLVDNRLGGNRAFLNDEQLDDICHRLHQYRPIDVLGSADVVTASGWHWTIPDLKRALQQWHGVVYQRPSSYRLLFKRCGFSYQRTARVFRSRSAKQVADFEEQLEKN
jgi:transposase